MNFRLAKPLPVMAGLALFGALALAFRPLPHRADLEVWAFDTVQVDAWRGARGEERAGLAEQYQRTSHESVDVRQVSARAIDTRLLSLINAGQVGKALPDVVTIEIGSIGKYFRPPVDQIGLLPLEGYLKRDGLEGSLVGSRLAPWTRGGHVFGIPNDVHPVSITYRRDLYEQAGVDLAAARTWPEFQEACLRFQRYWTQRGYAGRAAVELPASSADVLYMMLLQRGVNILDQQNRAHLDDPKVAATLAFYAQLVAGPRRIGAGSGTNPGARVRELADGDVCAMITPDWAVTAIRQWAPDLEGKLRMIPLPRFDAGDTPTSTWGGTMVGIPRHCADPEAAWQLLRFLMFSPPALEARAREATVLPAIVSAWSSPSYHQPDPLFGGQKIGELYIDLARQLPPRYVTPFTTIATGELSLVLHRAVAAVQGGADGATLERQCRQWLSAAQADLERYIRFGEFQ